LAAPPAPEADPPAVEQLGTVAVKAAQHSVTLVEGQSAKIPAFGYTAAGKRVTAKFAVVGKSVASVNKSGKITAKKVGKTAVLVRYAGRTKTIVVNVIGKDTGAKLKSVSAKAPKTVSVGASGYITATYAPARAVGTKVTFKSSNESVLSVDTAGRVLGKSPGTAKVTVTATSAAKKRVSKTYTIAVN
jgi:uncharacterized protein YjdB